MGLGGLVIGTGDTVNSGVGRDMLFGIPQNLKFSESSSVNSLCVMSSRHCCLICFSSGDQAPVVIDERVAVTGDCPLSFRARVAFLYIVASFWRKPRRTFMQRKCPLKQARCSAVLPARSRRLGSAPLSSKTFTISARTCSSSLALGYVKNECNGVEPQRS